MQIMPLQINFEDVLSEVAKYGVVTIRKAYGNWKNVTLRPWEEL